jgi:hypothetical protein
MHALVALQRADGSWELSKELAEAMGLELSLLESAPAGEKRSTQGRAAWATALALAWLDANAATSRAEWRLLAVKARAWLDGVPAPHPGGESWLESAAKFLKTLPSSV